MSLGTSFSSSPSVICEMFADRFREVFCPETHTPNTLSFPTTSSTLFTGLNQISLTLDDIRNALFSIDVNKGPGPDLIPPIFLFTCADQLSFPLHFIFNLSLSLGIFPSFWKSSFLTPIFKSGERIRIENYRGIAILSSIPKLFEKIICDKLTPHVDQFLKDQQHGFRKHRSTITNLTTLVSETLCNMEHGHQIDTIYTDFSKAFDRVSHSILAKKLHKIGITGNLLNWINSYLCDRIQFVKFQGYQSKEIKVLSGVPQGSHLGPLLFNIFITDLSDKLSDIPHLLYADDLKIYHIISSPNDAFFLQSKLTVLEEWCSENQLFLNVSKCCVITFSRKKSTFHYDYFLNNTKLLRVNQVNDLGVILDNKLRFNAHYDKIIAQAFKLLGFIKRRACEFKNVWVTKTLYCSLVRPILEYACVIWDPSFNIHHNRIESVQKQFLLFALRDLYDPRDFENLPHYTSRLKILNLLSLASRRTVLTSCFIFDVIMGNIDGKFISSKVMLNNAAKQTRNNNFLIERHHRTDYANNEPINRSCRTFNKFSSLFSPNISKDTFKKRLVASLNYS